jgi:hypothetical protein
MKTWRILEISPLARSSRAAGYSVLDFGDEKFSVEELVGGDNTYEATIYHELALHCEPASLPC